MIKDQNKLKDLIIAALEEKKAENITVLPLPAEIPLAHYIIFASGRSKKNVAAIAEYVADELKHKAERAVSIEGLGNSEWVLLDMGDIIVHIFHPETRENYKLEELWKQKIDKA